MKTHLDKTIKIHEQLFEKTFGKWINWILKLKDPYFDIALITTVILTTLTLILFLCIGGTT